METLWFVLVLGMLMMYVLLDGFDLGAGALHPFLPRDEAEKSLVFRAIGPVWDGNEVWLIAAGGTLFFAFPPLYAASFSGFYLPLMIVLWLLMMRGLAIELRGHLDHPLWRTFWDGVFFLGSAGLALFFGVALGNVVRGVPLSPQHEFFTTLWTNFDPRNPVPGILDVYTLAIGVLSLVALMVHGAGYLVLKSEGEFNARARALLRTGWLALWPLSGLATIATFALRPELLARFAAVPVGVLLPVIALGGLASLGPLSARGREWEAFLASCAYLGGMMASNAFALYPTVLPAIAPANSLTIYNAAASRHGLAVGLAWWGVGMILAATYFGVIYRLFRGKLKAGNSSS